MREEQLHPPLRECFHKVLQANGAWRCHVLWAHCVKNSSDMFKGDSQETGWLILGYSWLVTQAITSPPLYSANPRPAYRGTHLSWLKMRAVKVDTTVPRPPVIIHQGFWIRSPMKMMSPLRGLLANITWAAPLRTQSVNWKARGLSERDRQSHQQGCACASPPDHWLAWQAKQTEARKWGHFLSALPAPSLSLGAAWQSAHSGCSSAVQTERHAETKLMLFQPSAWLARKPQEHSKGNLLVQRKRWGGKETHFV